MTRCPSCESENRAGARFCRECGTPLELACPSCGAEVAPSQRFCDSCGAALAAAAPVALAPVAERRLVSILFADLVGFTSLSETRDAEEVRELLSRYFETCSRLVERYGGTVEKFIGDAVMAVWGTPVANEDDAERAVRTGLDLVAAVSGLADELGLGDLRLRVGILTGEAAVTVGARGEGMVAGDLVNTASRIQACAEPGTVLVGEATRRATEAAIAYDDLGFRTLKGKTEPYRLHRARRVIAARRGEGRSVGLEAPFVGRAREFRLIKELFHACAEERRARLVSIIGTAGSGKSRLGWEFEKYVDGLVEDVRWHRGRCLAYGDGVAYWALAEMVRMRARIGEEDEPEAAIAKLRESLAGIVESPDERAFLEPRLAHLLGLAERSAPDKEDLFSAWRLFFERLAAREAVVLVFEDLQWADAGLLDFVEYLLDWARDYPIYVLTLARPELAERRSAWGAGRRDSTSLFLEPLGETEVDELLAGLAPGLPTELRQRIIAQADGIPLYAVETVRMLLDRGLLQRAGDAYRPSGPIETLAVPETLQSLAAARLDALEPTERRLLADAAVLGKTFTRHGLAALAGLSEDELEPHLQSLLRKEILIVQLDPLMPERRQLSFAQDLVRRVAYETLSVHDRKTRHLAAAAHLAGVREGDDELAAVLAAHYLDAYRAAPAEPDADELRAQARAALVRAGERASSLASAAEGARYFAQAAELADDPIERAQLLERAGREATKDGALDDAHGFLQQAIELLEARGEHHAAARVAARRAEALRLGDRVDEALALMQSAYDALAAGGPDPDVALVAAQLARVAYFAGERDRALETVEVALDMAESLRLPEVLAEALTTKGTLLWHRPHESRALLQEAVRIAREHDLAAAGLRARFNLSGLAIEHDRLEEARTLLEEALAVARTRGDRAWEPYIIGQLADVLVLQGEWDESAAILGLSTADGISGTDSILTLMPAVTILVGRGRFGDARDALDRRVSSRDSSDRQTAAAYMLADARVRRADGRPDEALDLALQSSDVWRTLHQPHYFVEAIVEAVEAALELGELGRAETLLRELAERPAIERRPLRDAQTHRLRARLAARGGDGDVDDDYAAAAAMFRELGMSYWLAVTLLEHVEQTATLEPPGRDEQLDEARAIFERLGARPWLDRAERCAAAV